MISLNSGSNGNCVYVETGGVRLFFDAGLSGVQVADRLAAYGRSAEGADALFISHDHSDHVRCAGIFVRKFDVPMYITPRTYKASKRRMGPGEVAHVEFFRSGTPVKIKHVTVETIQTPHDGVDGSVFVVDDGVHRLGICTDLGHVYPELENLVQSVDGLFLESNYDERMLMTGNYPASLKRRIEGPGGHISNTDAAELVAQHASSKLQWVCLAHLSEENNTQEIALATHRQIVGHKLALHLGSRYGVSEPVALHKPAPSEDLVLLTPRPNSLYTLGL